MRKRRLRLALLVVALVGVMSWLVWPTSSPVIIAAKEKYARLQLGMPEAEVATILGIPPEVDRQVSGEWIDDRKLYKLQFTPSPGTTTRLLVHRAWNFGDLDHHINVQGVFDQARLVGLLYVEAHDNAAKRWLRELAARLSIRPKFLDAQVKSERQDIPPP